MGERKIIATWRFEDGSSIEVLGWGELKSDQIIWFIETWLAAKKRELAPAPPTGSEA